MTYKEYATNLYRFFGKISILSKISTPTEEIYNKKSKESMEREGNQYKQLKATFETISEEPSEGILFILSAIDQLTKNLDALFIDLTYENVQRFSENPDSITILENSEGYFLTFK